MGNMGPKPGFNVPKTYRVEDHPKTSAGKIEKYKLRERVRSLDP
jgi:non-ribosomal peptide synthetase component E (peptide arylation enzyme)